MAVDNFYQHFANNQIPIKPGIVIFTQSDPLVFGYPYNHNLLKSRRYLRPNQNGIWEQSEFNEKAFIAPEEIIKVADIMLNL